MGISTQGHVLRLLGHVLVVVSLVTFKEIVPMPQEVLSRV